MICKQTQNTIDTLLRLKSNEDLCVRAINQEMSEGKNNNKIASTVNVSANKREKGEVAEFISLLKTYIR